ncbi:MAG: hypothetical protein L0216_13410 [Planctomycetales bacterium]|nr:hypothetical protein [Planctomycetales bacterium]
MRRAPLIAAGGLLLALAGRASSQEPPAAPAPLAPPYLERAGEIGRETIEAYAPLVEWCRGRGLLLEARRLGEEILRTDPDHAIRATVAEIAKLSVAELGEASRRAGRKDREAFRATLGPLRSRIGRRYVELSKWAEKEKLPAESTDALVRSYRFVQDNAEVNRALARAGYDAIYNYGILDRDEKSAAAGVLQRLGGRFLHPALDRDYREELGSWPEAWGFETRHYQIVSDADHRLLFRFAEECENLHEGLRLFCQGFLPLRAGRPDERLVIWLFRDEPSYEVVLQANGIQKLPRAAGFYGAGNPGAGHRAFFFDSARFYEGTPVEPFRGLVETFYHEATHQMIDLRLDLTQKGSLHRYPSNWIVEAIANYMETMEVHIDSKGKKRFTFGFPGYGGWEAKNSQLAWALYLAKRKKFTPLLAFTTADYAGFHGLPHGYPQAMGLAHFLVHAEGGKYKRAFFDCVREQYTLGGSTKFLWEMLGMTEAQLLDALVAHCAALKVPDAWKSWGNSGGPSGSGAGGGSGAGAGR